MPAIHVADPSIQPCPSRRKEFTGGRKSILDWPHPWVAAIYRLHHQRGT